MTGIVFDIQKFALHDGPGIRTAVFLKGCPFRCVWCSNPESMMPKPQLAYIESNCNQCFQCVPVCPTSALSINDGKLEVNFKQCNACGKCVDVCPSSALKIYGYQVDSSTIIEEVVKDIDYFDNSGGGLTLSGGDPLYQFDFSLELLQKAKSLGINTCLETEAFVSQEKLKEILPWVDFFYIDYKITNDQEHKQYTGVSNKSIIENLDYIGNNHSHIVLRCVLVPGINDNDDHFKAIADLSIKYPAIRQVDIMSYHNYGAEKYQQIGRKRHNIQSETVTNELAAIWIKRIEDFGGINVVKG